MAINPFDTKRKELMAILKKEQEYFTRLYSAHHPFSIEQIVFYRDKLFWGGGFYTWEESDPYLNTFTTPKIGLCFNKSINWDKNLAKLAKFEINSFQGTGLDLLLIPLDPEIELKQRLEKFFYIDIPEQASDEINEQLIDDHLAKLYLITDPNRLFKIYSINALRIYLKSKSDFDLLQNSLYLTVRSLIAKFDIDFVKDVLNIQDIQLKLILHDGFSYDYYRQNAFWFYGKCIAEYQIRIKRRIIRYLIASEGTSRVKFNPTSSYYKNIEAINIAYTLDLDDRTLNKCIFKTKSWFAIYRKIGRKKFHYDVQFELDNSVKSLKILIVDDMYRLGINF